MGYLILAATNCTFQGVYKCEVGRTANLTTGAGACAMFVVGNVVVQSKRIVIHDCICDGGNLFIRGAINIDGLRIANSYCFDPFLYFSQFDADGTYTDVVVDNVTYIQPGPATRFLSFADATATDVTVRNCRAKAGSLPATGQTFLYATAIGAKHRIEGCQAENWDTFFNAPYGDYLSEVVLRDNTLVNVTTLYSVGNTAAKIILAGNVSNGVPMGQRTLTALATLVISDELILATGASVYTITLPADHTARKRITIKTDANAAANIKTIAGSGGDTIDGATSIALDANYASVTLESDGTNWWVVGMSV